MMHAGGPGGDPTGWGLMGNVLQPTAGLMQMPQFQQPQMSQGGPWSQMAYQMAGRPNQGPYANVATPPMPDGAFGGSTSGGSALGGTALGLLGSLANNPSALKSLGNLGSSALSKLGGLFGGGAPAAAAEAPAAAGTAGQAFAPIGSSATAGAGGTTTLFGDAGAGAADAAGTTTTFGDAAGGLLGSSAPAAGSVASIMAGGSPALATIGTSAVAPAADAAAANAAAALGSSGGSAAGGTASTGLGAAGNIALPIAMFIGQKMLFDKQSQWTPGQQYKNLQGQLATAQDPATQAQMRALGQDPQALINTIQGTMNMWNPTSQTFRDVGAELLAGGARSVNPGYVGTSTLSRNQL